MGTVGNAKCGDIMRIYLDIDEESDHSGCKIQTFGCGAAVTKQYGNRTGQRKKKYL